MKMGTKQTLKEVMGFWADALKYHNARQYETSLDAYSKVEDKSGRMYYNMGCAYIKLNQVSEALQCFTQSVNRDPHSAISFFQRGVVYLQCKRLDAAMSDFVIVHTLLRGNTFINYKQLGMLCKLNICEVLYNMLLVHIHKGDENEARRLLLECQHDCEQKHRKHILAAQEYLQGKMTGTESLLPMTISADLTYAPPKDVIANLNKKHVMGKAKVISASDSADSDPSFNGPKRVEQLKMATLQQPPKTPLVKVKQFLKNPGAKRDRSKSQGILTGQCGMKGSHSMVDLRMRSKSEGLLDDSLANTFSATLKKNKKSKMNLNIHKSSSINNLNKQSENKSPKCRNGSLGSIFGNTLSPVNSALSLSFDVLSSLVVPVNNSCPGSGQGFTPIGLDHEHFSSSSSDSADDDVTDVFIEFRQVPEILSDETGTKSSDEKNTFIFDFNDGLKIGTFTKDSTISAKETEENTKADGNMLENRISGGESPRHRTIPPPPSYPPPPLPPNIVANK